MKNTVVVYNMKAESTICFDGFCSALLLWEHFKDTATYLPALYHKSLTVDSFKGQDKDVFFVNFSYSRMYMDAVNACTKSLTVIAHQATTLRDLAGAPYLVGDGSKSTCRIVYEKYNTGELPFMVECIDALYCGKDLTEEQSWFLAALGGAPSNFEAWHLILNTPQSSLAHLEFIQLGKSLCRIHQDRCFDIMKDSFELELCGVKGRAVNANKLFANGVAHQIAEDCGTFGATFYMRPDLNVEFSLRSKTVDVEQIATFYGGGGHTEAAGFSMSFANFLTLLDPSRRMMDVCLRLDALLPAFRLSDTSFTTTTDEFEDKIFIYMHCHIGYLAEDLDIKVEKRIVDYSSLATRLGTSIANVFKLPTHSTVKKWYHYVLPYRQTRELTFDDAQIRELLDIVSSDPACRTNGFVADCLVKTVNIGYLAVLPKRSAFFTVTVGLGNSSLRSQHTYEVVEE